MYGTVFSIEEFSVWDGPGIRTTVFLKGCPLRCVWCHNPEGQEKEEQIVRSPNGCLGCGRCLEKAEMLPNETRYTNESIKVCPKKLLRICGEKFTPKDLAEKLLKNENILKKSGGVTYSGGEPFFQSDFLFETAKFLHGRLHQAVQTCGYTTSDNFKKALSVMDYFLFDLKLADNAMHRKYTGVDNTLIIENFKLLAHSNTPFVVRIPLIPGVTDTEDNILKLSSLIAENGCTYAELLPYNKMAGAKYKLVGREWNPCFDEEKEVFFGEDIFKLYGIKTKIL